jgi:hypothetical protein
MTDRKYIVGSGWYCEEGRNERFGSRYSRTVEFHESLWKPLLFRYSSPVALIIVDSNAPIPLPHDSRERVITLTDNFQLLPTRLNGWMRGFLLGAHFAYCCHADFFYVEQDCLAVGPWVQRTYECAESIGFSKFLAGDVWHCYPLRHRRKRPMRRKVPWDLQQSLVFVPRKLIPELLYRIAMINIPHSEDQMSQCGVEFAFLPFGVGRIRPIPMSDETVYAQHLSDDEVLMFAEREGLAERVRTDLLASGSWRG